LRQFPLDIEAPLVVYVPGFRLISPAYVSRSRAATILSCIWARLGIFISHGNRDRSYAITGNGMYIKFARSCIDEPLPGVWL